MAPCRIPLHIGILLLSVRWNMGAAAPVHLHVHLLRPDSVMLALIADVSTARTTVGVGLTKFKMSFAPREALEFTLRALCMQVRRIKYLHSQCRTRASDKHVNNFSPEHYS